MPSDGDVARPTPELPSPNLRARARGRSNLSRDSRTPVPDLREVGLPGSKLLAGQLFEDPNVALQGLRGLRKFQLMGYDPVVAALLNGTSLPIRGARWYVEPANEDDPKLVGIADFIEWNLYNFGAQSMDDIVRQAVHGMCQYGFNLSESVYARITDGQWAGKVGISKLAWRSPMAKWRWNVEEIDTPDSGRQRQLVSMTQLAPPNYVTVDIPREKFIHWALNMDGENFDGIGLARIAYKPWYFKDRLERIEAIGLERGYMGIPMATLPEDFTAKERDAARAIVENVRTSENAGIVHPAQIAFSMLFNKLEGTAMANAIERYRHEILLTYLAQFLLLGQGNIGSYALSNDQSDLFLMALNALANYFAEQINLWPGIPLWCQYNFPDVTTEDMPRLVHGEIGERNLERMGRTLMALSQGGFLTPDDETEDALREQLALPMRDPSLAPEALRNLIQGVPGTIQAGRKHEPRIPFAPVLSRGEAAGAVRQGDVPAKISAPDDSPDVGVTMAELRARMPWPRPQGRLTADDRTRIQNAEILREELGWKPGKPTDTPSERAWRRRRPYTVRGAESVSERVTTFNERVRAAETPRQRKRRLAKPPSGGVQLIAATHTQAVREAFVTANGAKLSEGHVDTFLPDVSVDPNSPTCCDGKTAEWHRHDSKTGYCCVDEHGKHPPK